MVDLSNIVRAEAAAKRAGVCTHGSVERDGMLQGFRCCQCRATFADEKAHNNARWDTLDPYL
jgi:hypothetical protein